MALEEYVLADGKRLRCGYTTGTCAAMAAAAACRELLTGETIAECSLDTPAGIRVTAETARLGFAFYAVRKDGGDDCDATHGALICARAEKAPAGVEIDGGEGVGRVTKPGLDQPVGAAAINTVPRRMIARAAEDERRRAGCADGLKITISVPGGGEIAQKTFNPRLGIEGGISILGTSGIVRPMSAQALVDTIAVELRAHAARGAREVILIPGNYGAEFLPQMGLPERIPRVTISNFFGDSLDLAADAGYETALIVAHLGKLVKLAGGVMNTHSRTADCRAEIFTAHAALAGADQKTLRALMESPTSDACLAILDGAGLREAVMGTILQKVQAHLAARAGRLRAGAATFSREYGLLGATDEGQKIWNEWRLRP